MSAPPATLHGYGGWGAGAPARADALDRARRIGAQLLDGAGPDAPRPAVVVVTGNARTLLSVRRDGAHFELRLAWQLLDDPELVVDSVRSWMQTGQLGDALSDRVAELGGADERDDQDGDEEESTPDAPDDARLRAVLDSVAELAGAPGAVAAKLTIGWSRRGRARRSLRLGSAQPRRKLIRIHPALDADSVPEYVLRMVVYHELCHCIAPPLSRAQAKRRGERHRIHHAEFRALEARYPDLEKANRWVRDNFERLLRF